MGREKATRKDPGIIILAAGRGKRMKSTVPKVLQTICGEPLLVHVLRTVYRSLAVERSCSKLAIVVGAESERIQSTLSEYAFVSELAPEFVLQEEPLGTGHAVQTALRSSWGEAVLESGTPVMVLPGDFPLLTPELVVQARAPLKRGSALRMVTAERENPTGYGRVVRRGRGAGAPVTRVVEEADANPKEKQIREVATSIYTFDIKFLKSGLRRLGTRNAQMEYYLPDLVAQASRAKKKTEVLCWARSEDLQGVNDAWELAEAGKVLNRRKLRSLAMDGIRVLDPDSTWVEAGVEIDSDVELHPGAILRGKTRVEKGAIVGPRSVLVDARVGRRAEIRTGTVAEDSVIGDGAKVGPYAHLRPGSEVGPDAKIGNFVELKKTKIGAGTSVAHLSYLGDAEVGQNVNIGCGFVTCNFDGRVIDGQRKHRTVIEDDVFMGSDCQTVAPVRIRKGAYVASGSTVTKDVEEGALAIARSRQVNKEGMAKRLRAFSESSSSAGLPGPKTEKDREL